MASTDIQLWSWSFTVKAPNLVPFGMESRADMMAGDSAFFLCGSNASAPWTLLYSRVSPRTALLTSFIGTMSQPSRSCTRRTARICFNALFTCGAGSERLTRFHSAVGPYQEESESHLLPVPRECRFGPVHRA